jgi:hypothetical protein
MSRIINTDLPAQRRNKLLRFISNSVSILDKPLLSQKDQNDVIAFIILSLSEIEKTINQSTAPWERRDYWIKADQLRSEWSWVRDTKKQLVKCKTPLGWKIIPQEIVLLKEKIKQVKPFNKIGDDFWKKAYLVFLKQE